MPKTFKLAEKDSLKRDEYKAIWTNGGKHFEDADVFDIPMEDALAHPKSTEFFPVTVESMVREAIEPMLVVTQLLDRIQYTPGIQMSFGSVGALDAADIDESGEYPEHSLNFGPGAQIITIGKSGTAIKFTDEFKRYSQYDLINLHIRAMGRALARHKEAKAFAMFSAMGVVTHDNVTPGDSVFGSTTGYDSDGDANGGLSADNIIEAYGQVLMNGFYADAILVHPLTYTMFMVDPVLRAFALANGGGQWYNGWNGNAATQYPWSKGILGAQGPGLGKESSSSSPLDLGHGGATMKLPNYLDVPLKVLVSPFVPYNHSTKLTNIFMVDSKNLGALIVDEEATMEEVPDRLRDITKIKIRERYALAPYHEGNAIAVLKNVKVTPNRLVMPVQATLDSFTEHDRTTTPLQ